MPRTSLEALGGRRLGGGGGLLQEGHTIQQHLLRSPRNLTFEKQHECSLLKLMMEGKVWAAFGLLSGGPPMSLDEEVEVKGTVLFVRDVLKQSIKKQN